MPEQEPELSEAWTRSITQTPPVLGSPPAAMTRPGGTSERLGRRRPAPRRSGPRYPVRRAARRARSRQDRAADAVRLGGPGTRVAGRPDRAKPGRSIRDLIDERFPDTWSTWTALGRGLRPTSDQDRVELHDFPRIQRHWGNRRRRQGGDRAVRSGPRQAAARPVRRRGGAGRPRDRADRFNPGLARVQAQRTVRGRARRVPARRPARRGVGRAYVPAPLPRGGQVVR